MQVQGIATEMAYLPGILGELGPDWESPEDIDLGDFIEDAKVARDQLIDFREMLPEQYRDHVTDALDNLNTAITGEGTILDRIGDVEVAVECLADLHAALRKSSVYRSAYDYAVRMRAAA